MYHNNAFYSTSERVCLKPGELYTLAKMYSVMRVANIEDEYDYIY